MKNAEQVGKKDTQATQKKEATTSLDALEAILDQEITALRNAQLQYEEEYEEIEKQRLKETGYRHPSACNTQASRMKTANLVLKLSESRLKLAALKMAQSPVK